MPGLLYAFDRANPDTRHFRRIENYVIRNTGRKGLSWTDEEREEAREAALKGVPMMEYCEKVGRPFTGVAQQYLAAGVLFRDAFYAYWERIPEPQPILKETTMTKNIETKTFIAGIDGAGLSDTAIFQRIAKLEQEKAALEAIKNKPKKLIAAIEQLQKDIEALVKYVDERDTPVDEGATAKNIVAKLA